MPPVFGRGWRDLSLQSGVHRVVMKKEGRIPVTISVLMQRLVSCLMFCPVQSAKSLPGCSWGHITQAEPFLRGTECSERAGKGSPRAVPRAWCVCLGAHPGRDQQELQSTLEIHSKQPQEGFSSCTVCLCFLSSPALCAPSPEGDVNVLAEICANTACRADQKPASHSQLSLLIVACATGANHIIIRWIYEVP